MRENNSALNYGSWYKRFLAYLIDILPITLIVFVIFYFLGFNVVLTEYLAEKNNLGVRIEYLTWRNWIRDLSFIIYIIYSIILESSKLQGTLGKYLLGLMIVKDDYSQLNLIDSTKRNLFKIISKVPISLGFIWILFNKKRKGWHDYFAKTNIIER